MINDYINLWNWYVDGEGSGCWGEDGETIEGSLVYSRKFAGIDFSLIFTFRVREMALEM